MIQMQRHLNNNKKHKTKKNANLCFYIFQKKILLTIEIIKQTNF